MLYDENDLESNCMDTEAIRDWLDEQRDDANFCPNCLTALVKTMDNTYFCPNDFCLDERIWVTKED